MTLLRAALVAFAVLAAGTPSAHADMLFSATYDDGLDGWNGVQAEKRRIKVSSVPAAGTPGAPQRRRVMRVELRDRDFVSEGNRAEVYGRNPSPWSSTPPARWPDPAGSVRWYEFSVYLPLGWRTTTDTRWLTLTQWKGYRGGGPPVAIEVKRDRLNLGGKRIRRDIGPLPIGHWTKLLVGMRLSPNPRRGWIRIYRDGQPVLPLTRLATMDKYSGVVDPIYLKQGIYRSSAWDGRHVAYFGPTRVYDRRPHRRRR